MMGACCAPPLMVVSESLLWMEAVVPSLLTLVKGGGLEWRLAEGGGGAGVPACMNGLGGLCVVVVESDSDALLW